MVVHIGGRRALPDPTSHGRRTEQLTIEVRRTPQAPAVLLPLTILALVTVFPLAKD